MSTDRHVKWSENALDFFQSSPDDSVNLTFIVCHGCISQSGEGFEEFVNSINSKDIKRKIKKLSIIDASYLYRHCIPGFAKYSDPDIPTIWFSNNRGVIEKITVPLELISWLQQIKCANFEKCRKQIMKDYHGDENGNGLVSEFNNIVTSEAEKAAARGKGPFEGCRDFILEECAHACTYLKNTIITYPMPFNESMLNVIKRYNLNMQHVHYGISNHARRHQKATRDYPQINQELVRILTEALEVNFFVTDKFGNFIYKNNSLSHMIGGIPADVADPHAWQISQKVIETGQKVVIEEQFDDIYFLSIKTPLVIDNKIEGVIGLAVDITDRKKAEQFEKQKELKTLTEQIAHDIRSPLIVLSMLTNNCKSLSESEHITLRNAIANIECILNGLLEKYKEKENPVADKTEEQHICIPLSILDALKQKMEEYKKLDIAFNYNCNLRQNLVFIKGDYLDFGRMFSNLINNAVEAIEGRKGKICVDFGVKNQKIEIRVKDNGKGMPTEIVDKIMEDKPVTSGKVDGHGIGMQQIRRTLKAMNGEMSIKSTENIGTEIRLTFPECEAPQWFSNKIVFRKGDTIVVLDDDQSIHNIWKRRFENYASDITIKYFTRGRDAIDFINSIEDKSKAFLLVDYELRGQSLTGIDVIEQSGMQNRNILITNVYTSRIKNFSEKCKIFKMFPKTAEIDNISLTEVS